jgi:outer membrane translocation and assembly module TamA
MNLIKPIGIIWLFFFTINSLFGAEDTYWLKIYSQENLKEFKISPLQKFSTDPKRDEYLKDLLTDLKSRMYIEASIDSIWTNNIDTLEVLLHIGRSYDIKVELPEVFKKSKRSGSKFFENNFFNTIQSIDQQLVYWQENGYPFAEISWDSLTIDSLQIQMKAKIDKGPLITFDSISNKENGKISESFLKSYLGIKKDMPYQESVLSESDKLLKKLPFVRFVKPSTVSFHSNEATINIYLAQRKVSKFDFLVGLLPNSESTGKILITGEAKLQLQNAFKRGEEIYFEWKRVKANSQQLKLKFNYPYILQSPIGATGTFLLDKRDSTFLDINWTLGVPYRTKANNYIKAYVENAQTIVLNLDTLSIKNRMKLPSIQDVSALLYGFEGYFENLDYLFNPRKGFEAGANVQVGTRKIKPNNTITNLGENYAALYDSIQLKSFQAQFSAHISAYVPFGNRQVAKFGFNGASKLNQKILENELYRIGGANLLRGFNEESIFTQHYAVATVEYRFILDQNSYFYTFFDAAFVAKKFEDKFSKDFPFGFGAGIAFETKAGIFGVNYAVGRQQNNPIDFRTSKIHFGYVNIF